VRGEEIVEAGQSNDVIYVHEPREEQLFRKTVISKPTEY
jgi:hypothetical protein